jgi:hypothetical protein
MGSTPITPAAHACSSRRAGSFTEAPALGRDASTSSGNKQGTSNSGTQPPTTSICITRTHAGSGQALRDAQRNCASPALQAGGRGFEPLTAHRNIPANTPFRSPRLQDVRRREQATLHSALEDVRTQLGEPSAASERKPARAASAVTACPGMRPARAERGVGSLSRDARSSLQADAGRHASGRSRLVRGERGGGEVAAPAASFWLGGFW